jgi:hypothetical protein
VAKLQKKKKLIDPALEPNIHVSKKKKIGFISSIMLVIGSSVGAGIFIKN